MFPDTLLAALVKRKDVQNLTAVSNNAGAGDNGLGAHALPNLTRSGRLNIPQESYSIPSR